MTNREVILLVEDNPFDEELTRMMLRKSHLANELVVARDGAEALDYLFGNGGKEAGSIHPAPILVLLDLKLPKIDGLEVVHQMRANDRTKRLPVVFMTSSEDQEIAIRTCGIVAGGFVRKPLRFERLIEVARNLGLGWLLLGTADGR